ncbi:unnamed protein product [Protopolystoma xenopodis]|uniref:Uncharacterized protein n=1 Tax=Protopolystoma xenopodis TaxID=117903 RepID=A0A3S5CQ52_9PLAT|nr:unnamed protein product [Protopolystoma xenopodis]
MGSPKHSFSSTRRRRRIPLDQPSIGLAEIFFLTLSTRQTSFDSGENRPRFRPSYDGHHQSRWYHPLNHIEANELRKLYADDARHTTDEKLAGFCRNRSRLFRKQRRQECSSKTVRQLVFWSDRPSNLFTRRCYSK